MGLLKLSQKKYTGPDPVAEAYRIAQELGSEFGTSCRVYLFGSALSEHFNSDSDIDLLVVVDDATDLKGAQQRIYSRRRSNFPIDFIIKSTADFLKMREIGGVCFEAYHHGRELSV
jgi:predicted nucleotidyltransferase